MLCIDLVKRNPDLDARTILEDVFETQGAKCKRFSTRCVRDLSKN